MVLKPVENEKILHSIVGKHN